MYVIKRGDLVPSLTATFTDQAGIPVDLTGCTVVFHFGQRPGATTPRAAVVTSAAAGQVRVDWESGDTDLPGPYIGEFVITNSLGKERTAPSNGLVEYVVGQRISD